MKVYTEHFPQIGGPYALCIGKFDGVHIGHRLILDTLLTEAARHSAVSLAYSFEPHNGTPLLTTREEKLALFEGMGVSSVVLAEFTGELMSTPAEQFIGRLAACGALKAVAVGQGFRFGRGAAGDVELLKALGRRYGFDVHVIAQMRLDGQPVSSTLIRESVKSGDVEKAAMLLGREYSLSGEVIRGRQLARRLGFRTANIQPPVGKVIPMNGVYACRVDAAGQSRPAMVNIGIKPTVNGTELLIENHLLDYEGDLYGQRITVRLLKRIRDELRFDSVQALAEQLAMDESAVRRIFHL